MDSAVLIKVDSDAALLSPVERLEETTTELDTALLSAVEVKVDREAAALVRALRLEEIFVELDAAALAPALAPVLAPELAPAERPADSPALAPAELSILDSSSDSTLLSCPIMWNLLNSRKSGVLPEAPGDIVF